MGGGKEAQTSYCLGLSCFLVVLCLFFVVEAKSGGRRKRGSNVVLFRIGMVLCLVSADPTRDNIIL